jgi:hypothetical protein
MTWLRTACWRLFALLPALLLATAAAAHPIGSLDDGASAVVTAARLDPPGEAAIALVDQPLASGSPAHDGSGPSAEQLAESPGELLVHRDDPATARIDPTAAPADASSGATGAWLKRNPQQHSSAAPQRRLAPQAGEEIGAAMSALEDVLLDTLLTATDAHRDPDGRIVFSLAGLDGFHLAMQGRAVSIGHGELSLATVGQGDGLTRDEMQQAASRGSPQAANDGNPARQLIVFAEETIQYPLFWVVIGTLLIGKAALLVARRQGRRRSRRMTSRSRQPVQAKPIRKRVRFRLKRRPLQERLQGP